MPADVPVDEQAGLRNDAWLRWYWLWDLSFAVVYVSVGLLVLLRDDDSLPNRLGAAGVLTVMAAGYVFFGRGHIVVPRERGSVQGRFFAAGLVVPQLVAVTFDGDASFALFALCPLMFMSLALREAIIVVVALSLVPPLASLIRDGLDTALGLLGPMMVFTVLLGVTMGTWIHRIVSESQERAELIMKLEESREEVGRLSREAGVAAERARLAAEIHDTLAQGFTSLVTLVQAAESELDRDIEKARGHLTLAARTARENLTEARALVAGLTPTALGTGSLDEAIRRQLERFAEETPVSVSYRADGDSVTLPTVLEVVLLRMVQESLTNVRKHSRATEVTITLQVKETCASMRVTDNGAGFDPDEPADGFGLRGMRNRAAEVGGRLSVRSGSGGTTVELEVPR
ncbi:sensor histidine kinase [Actinophytocola sp.]|uniref:sensor histidine kinase n=1 Tax=Actinophytocola sp. TaxID=1872138 RepID=UPI002D3DC462|nr:sensor histidine kinase [Actinophytocola sp.]HYQ69390.1 sensor histidine kinase [Actinophytocola sp.]